MHHYSTDQQRWLALISRDPSANSAFFYGVTSTLIFCRPTCPGRLPRRANTRFFDDLTAAEEAGYRPCKRCEPCKQEWARDASGRDSTRRSCELITSAVETGQRWTVEGVASQVGISAGHLHRLFRKYLNTSPKAFAAAQSQSKAAEVAIVPVDGMSSAGDSCLSGVDSNIQGSAQAQSYNWCCADDQLDEFISATTYFPSDEAFPWLEIGDQSSDVLSPAPMQDCLSLFDPMMEDWSLKTDITPDLAQSNPTTVGSDWPVRCYSGAS